MAVPPGRRMARGVGEEVGVAVAVPPGGVAAACSVVVPLGEDTEFGLADGCSRRALAEFRRGCPNWRAVAEGEVELLCRGRARGWIALEKFVEVLHGIAVEVRAAGGAPSSGGPERRGRWMSRTAAEPYARGDGGGGRAGPAFGVRHDWRAWLNAFRAAGDGTMDPDMERIRSLRQEIWWQTAAAIGDIDLSMHTRVQGCPRLGHRQRPQVRVLNKDMLEVALEEVSRGHVVAAVNMASEKSPGGGVERGAGAQEENMFRRTNLANFLPTKFYPLRYDTCLVSEGVLVWRGGEASGYEVLDGEQTGRITVLSCAALKRVAAEEGRG